MTANRWMSCGACHLDGGVISDGLVWDLTAPPDQQTPQRQETTSNPGMGGMGQRRMGNATNGPMNKISIPLKKKRVFRTTTTPDYPPAVTIGQETVQVTNVKLGAGNKTRFSCLY
jgi:hypothetical protein